MKGSFLINRKTIIAAISLILTLCCALLIFFFSMQNGNQSALLSNELLMRILSFIKRVPINKITYDDIKEYSFLIRKIAHFLIFLMLGMLSCCSAWSLIHKRYILISFIFCFIYACSDELHQFFSKGRSPAVRDVFIDSLGAFIGIFIMSFIISCISRYFDRKNTQN